MGEFQRSSSKVWWADESLSWRANSSSPGSQDSGFSDTETSPQLPLGQQQNEPRTPEKRINDALAKQAPTSRSNLTSEIIEKSTPTKSIRLDGLLSPRSAYYMPQAHLEEGLQRQAKTEPSKRHRGARLRASGKASRNLFRLMHTNGQQHDDEPVVASPAQQDHQYACDASNIAENSDSNLNASAFDERQERRYAHEHDIDSDGDDEEVSGNRTLPFASRKVEEYPPNLSAPASLCPEDHYEITRSFNECSAESEPKKNEDALLKDEGGALDDSDTEMETYFQLKSPKHTSTPKLQQKQPVQRLGRIHALNLLQKYQQESRTRPQEVELLRIEGKTSVEMWIKEQRRNFEPECMTTLQCKSIAAELANKVGHLAMKSTSSIRNILKLHAEISAAFDYFITNKQARHESAARLLPLIQEYLDHLNLHQNGKELNLKQVLETSASAFANTMNLTKLRKVYMDLHRKCLGKCVEKFTDALADPANEMEVRARLTAVASLNLRDGDQLIPVFLEHGAIQTITAIIEKCEGSSVRGLGLRALTTLCVNAHSIRKLENVSGLATLTDIVCDRSRPEPERTEAIALLAQITAPWIEDNHHVRGLHTFTKRLIKHLTRYLETTSCCQNVLLASAALANLAAMEAKAVMYIVQHGTVGLLLDVVKTHGSIISVYILEQVANLIATVSAVAEARRALCEICAPVALLSILQTRFADDEDVVVRLQQRAVIGLSRLCTERQAAEQIVDAGGIDKLVQLCKEKRERYNNDAILVAALATLRKITEVCGPHVVNEEDAQELIQPNLLASFKAYSTQSESLV